MGRENIGSVTGWESGGDRDWAYEMALSFLAAALGDPPAGVSIDIVSNDHDLGSYPSLAVLWEDGTSEPWDFIRRTEEALTEFDNAIEWHRIRPSDFWPETDDGEETDQ